MGLLSGLKKVSGGYPGGWRKWATGKEGAGRAEPFVQPTNPDDRRSQVPPLGLREYWYPAIPAKDVGTKKPVALKMLGERIVLFKDKHNEVQALWDVCPHRGVFLSWGDCVWKGYLSCPYHGATFDGDGECVEFITEGPDSKMVGQLKARKFPTRTLKGIVFVWMGEGEPVPIEEDVPPEFFEGKETLIEYTIRYWDCNWMIALENQSDAHNCFWVHRNSFVQLRSRTGGRPRTPLGYRPKVVNGKAVVPMRGAEGYYADKTTGKVPYQMHYPRTGGVWPLHRYRLLWTWFFEFFDRRNRNRPRFQTPEEWQGMHLPGMHRLYFGGPEAMYTRWCVPVEKDLTRVVYFRSMRLKTAKGRLWERLSYVLYRNYLFHYNFSDQDYDAMRSTMYQYPEYLSATDSHVVAQRKLIVEHGRGLKANVAVGDMTTAEKLVADFNKQIEGERGAIPVRPFGPSSGSANLSGPTGR